MYTKYVLSNKHAAQIIGAECQPILNNGIISSHTQFESLIAVAQILFYHIQVANGDDVYGSFIQVGQSFVIFERRFQVSR